MTRPVGLRPLEGAKHVRRAARGADADGHVARPAVGLDLPAEDRLEAHVVAHRGHDRGVGGEGDRGQGPPVHEVAAHELPREVLGVGRRARRCRRPAPCPRAFRQRGHARRPTRSTTWAARSAKKRSLTARLRAATSRIAARSMRRPIIARGAGARSRQEDVPRTKRAARPCGLRWPRMWTVRRPRPRRVVHRDLEDRALAHARGMRTGTGNRRSIVPSPPQRRSRRRSRPCPRRTGSSWRRARRGAGRPRTRPRRGSAGSRPRGCPAGWAAAGRTRTGCARRPRSARRRRSRSRSVSS